MKDNWINHNTDKILLFVLVILSGLMVLHMLHHGADHEAITWGEGLVSTFDGALIMVLTGRISRADNQTANGAAPTSAAAPPVPPAPPASESAMNKAPFQSS